MSYISQFLCQLPTSSNLHSNLQSILAWNSTTPHPSPLLLAPQFLSAVLPLFSSSAIAVRTLQAGTASWTDILIICPGIHTQQQSEKLAGGDEYPATAAMTTGYVFRTENQAMVGFMQRIGRTGELVTCLVEEDQFPPRGISGWEIAALAMSGAAVSSSVALEDWAALAAIGLLVGARATNVAVMKRRLQPGWHGLKEPGVKGDLLVLLSQDRWLRLQGLVDDLKAVTSGSWLQKITRVEQALVGLATIMVYAAGVVAMGASILGAGILVLLLLGSMLCLEFANSDGSDMKMHGKSIKIIGEPKKYVQRKVLAEELIAEHRRDDWAITMGMIVPGHNREKEAIM